MSTHNSRNYLGEILIQSGNITKEQLAEAMHYQKERRQKGARDPLGSVLIELGFASEEAVTRALANQAGVAVYSLESYSIDSTASMLLDPETARRYQALPIDFESGNLVVAMANPANIIAVDDLRLLTGYEITTVIVPDSELQAALDRFTQIYFEGEHEAEEDDSEVITTDESTEKPVVQLVNHIFNNSVQVGASDVHIEPGEKSMRVRFRIDGVLHEVMQHPRRMHAPLVSRLKVMANMDIAERRIPQDGRVTLKIGNNTVDVRVASLPSAYGEKLTLRLLNRSAQLITLEELGFPEEELSKYKKMMKLPYGFLLVTGPTGSGKSTTLYATLKELNDVKKQIITVEDPIEYRMEGINQVQVNPKAGLFFSTGLRSILRNDPDIIMIGEIRDHETARIAVESSLTGHLVLSTIHTNDAAGAIIRLGDMGIETYLTSSSLNGVLAQRLARVLCKNCKAPQEMTRQELLNIMPNFPLDDAEEKVTLYRPVGCMRCNNTGYHGRLGIYELLEVTENIQQLVLNRSSAGEIKEMAIQEGMTTLQMDGLRKVKQGITSLEEAMRVNI